MKVLVTQSCPALRDTVDCSPPGSPVHGTLWGRILEWVDIPFSRGSSWPRDQTQVSCIAGRFFTIWATRETVILTVINLWTVCFFLRLLLPSPICLQSVQSLSRVQLFATPMDCSRPGLPVHSQLPEFTQTRVHWVGDAIQPSLPLSSPSPPTFNLS